MSSDQRRNAPRVHRVERTAAMILIALFIAVSSGPIWGQNTIEQSLEPQDIAKIHALLSRLASAPTAPATWLDPQRVNAEREKDFSHFHSNNWGLRIESTGGVVGTAPDRASVPVHVYSADRNGNSFEAESTAQFIKRDAEWYFANYDFMGSSTFLRVVLSLGFFFGIGYATVVLNLLVKMRQRQDLDIADVKVYIPFFWPSLFRRLRQAEVTAHAQ